MELPNKGYATETGRGAAARHLAMCETTRQFTFHIPYHQFHTYERHSQHCKIIAHSPAVAAKKADDIKTVKIDSTTYKLEPDIRYPHL